MAILTTSYQRLAQAYLGTSGGDLYVRVYAKYSEQDIANNRTKVQYQARAYYENGTYIYDMQGSGSVSGTGASTASGSCTRPTTGETTIATTEGWVYHNDDGKKNISCSASINFPNWGWNATASASADLPTIPRASGVSCSSPNIGDAAIITIDRKSSTFTNTVTYQIGTLSGVIATKTSQTVLSLSTSELIEEIYAQIPSSTYIQGTVTCTTYSGNTQIGSPQSCGFRLYAVKDDAKPTISGVVIDTNASTIAITQDSNKLIKYVSKPKVTITATAKYGSTIEGYSINLNDGQTANSQEYTFDSIGSDNISINAIDSRGYDNPTNIDLSDRMIDYIKLHIDNIILDRPEETSNEVILEANGVWFNDSFNETTINSLSINFQYKKSSEAIWNEGGTLTPTISDNTFKFENCSLGELFDYQEEYQVKIIVEDIIMTVGDKTTDIITVPKGQETIAIGDDGGWLYGEWFLNDEKIRNGDCYKKVLEGTASYVEIDYDFEKNSIYEIYGNVNLDDNGMLSITTTPIVSNYSTYGIANLDNSISTFNREGSYDYINAGPLRKKIFFKIEIVTFDSDFYNIKLNIFTYDESTKYIVYGSGYFTTSTSDALSKIKFEFAANAQLGSTIRMYKK